MTDMPTTYDTHQTTTTTTSSGPGPIQIRKEYIRTIPGILKIVEIVLSMLTFICAAIDLYGFAGTWVLSVSISAFISATIYFFLYLLGTALVRYQRNVLVVLDIIVFICSVIPYWRGEGWVGFVAMTACLTTIVLFFLYLFGLMGRAPGWMVMVMVDFIGIICSSVGSWPRGSEAQAFTQFVCIVTFLVALTSLILHILGLISRFPGPWIFIEFIYYCIFSVFYLIAAIVAASFAARSSAVAACTFFAFAATAIYAVDTFFQFRAWRSGQAEMTTTHGASTTTTTTVHQTQHVESTATY